jgi:hypothetical protein
MNDDELTQRLRRLEPNPNAPVHPTGGAHAARLLEQIMNTPTNPDQPRSPSSSRPTRWVWAVSALGAVAAVALVVGLVATRGDDEPAATSVTYGLVAGDPMAMCLSLDEFQPDPATIGFRGTVVSVGDGSVTLDVTKWYRGGDADQVVLTVSDDMSVVALDGVEFVAGGDYLVGVLDGQVLICGVSAPFDPALEALYDRWFAA